jgi:hypothetical protein
MKRLISVLIVLLICPIGQGVVFAYLGEGFWNGFIEGLLIDFVFALFVLGVIAITIALE